LDGIDRSITDAPNFTPTIRKYCALQITVRGRDRKNGAVLVEGWADDCGHDSFVVAPAESEQG
jgi:hypothetical protein